MQRFGLITRPPIIRSTKFFRECFKKVTHLRNTLRLAKLAFIFSNERSFFTFFVPLPWLDHIPFELLLFGQSRFEMPEQFRALACLVFEISTVIHVFITHCVVSSDWVRGRDRMQLGAANRVTCSANEVLYPVKWDRMLVKGSRLCTIPRHERDFFRSISQKLDLLELSFFQVSCISIGQTKLAQRGCDPGSARG